MKKLIPLICLLVLTSGFALTQEHPEHPKKKSEKSAEIKVIEATVTGENFCLGCFLKKEKGSAAQCRKYGHRHALRVASATADGKDLPELKGLILHYLYTDKAQPFIRKHHNKMVTIRGKVFPEERLLEVDRQEQEGTSEHPEHPKKPEHPEHPK